MTNYDIIEGAIGLLETKGWCQNASARDTTGREITAKDYAGAESYCISGAVEASMVYAGLPNEFISNRYNEIMGMLDKELGSAFVYSYGFLSYNDASDRTKKEVVAVMRGLQKTVATYDD